MIEEALRPLGVSKTETKVYTALLPLGESPASAVGTRLKIPRSTSQYTCEQLRKKGLVTALMKNNTFYYTAKEPEALYSLLATEKKETRKKESDLEQVMGHLKQLFNTEAELPKIHFFEGVEEINKMFKDVLDERKPIYGCLYYSKKTHSVINNFINQVYIPERQKSGLPSRMLLNDNEAAQEYQKKDKSMNRVTLLLSEKDFPFDICFHIYGDKVAFYSHRKGNYTGIIIKDKHIRNMHFSMFKMAWNFAKNLPANKTYSKIEID